MTSFDHVRIESIEWFMRQHLPAPMPGLIASTKFSRLKLRRLLARLIDAGRVELKSGVYVLKQKP